MSFLDLLGKELVNHLILNLAVSSIVDESVNEEQSIDGESGFWR